MASPEQPFVLTPKSGRVRRASRLATRASRSVERQFLAEGPQAVREALGAGDAVVEVFATAAATDRHGDLYSGRGSVEWHVVDDAVVNAICDTVHPQGMVARCRFVDIPLEHLLAHGAQDRRLVVVCVDIRDPGNAGTVIRSADAAGADAVVFAGNSVDPFNPKAVRASVGSIFHVPISICIDTVMVIEALRNQGLQVFATDGNGSVDLFGAEIRLGKPTAWLLGNEAHGLAPQILAAADMAVAVPIFGKAESLNLATAAAVCLYASARAQRETNSPQKSLQQHEPPLPY